MLGRRKPVRSRGILNGDRRLPHCDLSALRNELVLEGKSETVVTEVSLLPASLASASSLLSDRPSDPSPGESSGRSRPPLRGSKARLFGGHSLSSPPVKNQAAKNQAAKMPAAKSPIRKPSEKNPRGVGVDGSSAFSSAPQNDGAGLRSRPGVVGGNFAFGVTPIKSPLTGIPGKGASNPGGKSPSTQRRKMTRETEILFGNIDLDGTDTDPFEH